MSFFIISVVISIIIIYFLLFTQKADNNLKIIFVNVRKSIFESPQLSQIQNKLDHKFEVRKQFIIKVRNKITDLETEYYRDSNKKILLKLKKIITEQNFSLAEQQKNYIPITLLLEDILRN